MSPHRPAPAAALVATVAALVALLQPALCQTPPLSFGVILSEGPDTPDCSKKPCTTVPWGSIHITLAGYAPCQTAYDSSQKADKCTNEPFPGPPQQQCPKGKGKAGLQDDMKRALRKAWTVANGGSAEYKILSSELNTPKATVAANKGKCGDGKNECRAMVTDTGGQLNRFVKVLCSRGFTKLKGPFYDPASYPWHISLDTKDEKEAEKRLAKYGPTGKLLKLWLVPCRTNSTCEKSADGCPCGNYKPGTATPKPKGQDWEQILPCKNGQVNPCN